MRCLYLLGDGGYLTHRTILFPWASKKKKRKKKIEVKLKTMLKIFMKLFLFSQNSFMSPWCVHARWG